MDATNKKHEAIIADIMSRESRVHDLAQMCDELIKENYRDSEKVKDKHQKIKEQWDTLMALLDKHKKNLNRMGQIMSLLREIDTTMVGMQQLKSDLSTLDTGVHLIAVEELQQRHALQELQLTSFGDSVKKLQRLGDQVQVDNAKEKELVKNKLESLQAAYKELQVSRRLLLCLLINHIVALVFRRLVLIVKQYWMRLGTFISSYKIKGMLRRG